MRFKIIFLITLVSLLTVNSPVLQQYNTQISSQYVVIDTPITIDGNTDFATKATDNSWSGDGTIGNPFAIDNIEMQGNSTTILLEIKNTDVYFIIQNSFFNGSLYGISMDNVRNGLIKNNDFISNDYGLYLNLSPDNIVSGNSFENNIWGLYPSSSDNTTISGNLFNNNSFGIYHRRSDRAAITNNVFNGSLNVGLYLDRSHYNYIYQNSFSYSNIGVQSLSTIYNNITENVFDSNEYGLYISSTSWTNVSANEYVRNNIGIFFTSGSGNNITGNMIYNNAKGLIIDRQSISFGSEPTNIWENDVFNNTYIGISVNFGKIVRVYRNRVYDNLRGIGIFFGDTHEIFDNDIYDNGYGIYLDSASNPNLQGNELVNNGFFITHYVDSLSNYNINTLENNTVNGKPVAYYNNTSGETITGNYGQIILVNTTQMTVENNVVNGASVGVLLLKSSFIEVKKNSLADNTQGIGLYNSNNITINNNKILNSDNSGIYLVNSVNSTISNNDLTLNYEGIHGTNSDNSIISNNTIRHSLNDGIYYEWSDNLNFSSNIVYSNGFDDSIIDLTPNRIELFVAVYNKYNNEDNGISLLVMTNSVFDKNTFYDNKGYGMYISGGVNNIIQQNDFFNNGYPLNFTSPLAYPLNQLFIQNNSTVSVSNNYFNDGDHTDNNFDGLCDTPYSYQGDNEFYQTDCYSEPIENHHILTRPRLRVVMRPGSVDGVITLVNVKIEWNYGIDNLKHTVFHDLTVKSKDGNNVIIDTKDILYQDTTINLKNTNMPDGVYQFTLRAYDKMGLEAVTIKEFTISNAYVYSPPPSMPSDTTTSTTVDDNITTKNDVLDDELDTKDKKKAPLPFLPVLLAIVLTQVIRLRKRNSYKLSSKWD